MKKSEWVQIQRSPEAKVALCKCTESKKIYGVRMERSGAGWISTWAFPVNEASAKREGYDTTFLKGSLGRTEDYPGCPYCGSRYFVICGNCQKLNCNIASDSTFTCGWCGNTGTLTNYTGEGIASGGDRG